MLCNGGHSVHCGKAVSAWHPHFSVATRLLACTLQRISSSCN